MIGGGDDEENQDLIAALEAEGAAEDQHAYLIGEGEMQAPEDLVNATNEQVPESYLEAPAFEENTSSEDPFALKEAFADEVLGEGLAAATDAGLAGEFEADFGGGSEAGDPSPAFGETINGEASDLGVDEMLAAALPDGDFDLGALDLSAAVGHFPTFSLQIEIDDPGLKPRLKELAAAQGINLSPSAWEHSTPLLSQLTEYQAVLFQKEARAMGARVRPVVSFPVPQPSEEELALGDLAEIAEPGALSSEGAPSVALPKSEKGVMLFTGELLPGFLIRQTLGPVSAHRRIARRIFRDEEIALKMKRELARAAGRSAAPADSHLQLLFRETFLELQKQALSLGGNAVLSLRVESFRETAALDPSSAELRLLVIGTAAVVETA